VPTLTITLALVMMIDALLSGAPQAKAATEADSTTRQAAVTGATEAGKSKLISTSNKELMFDKSLILPEGRAVDRASKPAAGVIFGKLQVGSKDDKSVFLEIGFEEETALSAGLATAIAQAARSSDATIQACVGKLVCVRVCDVGGKHRCCEWKCEKN